MASGDRPQTWAPYEPTKDCSQGFCSFYCPQWCYIIFPPPPPFDLSDPSSSGPSFSPLVITIIGILASAFLLVSYYTIISKYCGGFESFRRRLNGGHANNDVGDDAARQSHQPEVWQMTVSDGLDESVIRSIAVCKYKKGDGFVDGTDCSVCLAEFREDESLRLLPKCAHAFHVQCIDTWLKSHSNCPLCRAIVISPDAGVLPQLPAAATEQEEVTHDANETAIAMEDLETGPEEEIRAGSKDPRGVDVEMSAEEGDRIIEMEDGNLRSMRPSLLMGTSLQNPVLCMKDDCPIATASNLAESSSGERSKATDDDAWHSLARPVATKRSFSSGRSYVHNQKHGEANNSMLPI